VHEQRGQQAQCEDIAPVENQIERIEPATERKGEHAKEGDGEPEEVQRRRILRPAQTHGGADQQREDAGDGENVVERAITLRDRIDLDGNQLPCVEA
jgi:hypothetical protein